MNPTLLFRPIFYKTSAALAAFFALTLAGQSDIIRAVEKSFPVQPGVTVNAETSGGDITITTGADDQVKVTAVQRIRTGSEEKADELLKDLDLRMEQTGDRVTLVAKYKRSGGWHWGSWPPVSVAFQVVMPGKGNVDLRTSGGDIRVASLTGQAKLRTSGGDINLARIDGEVEGSTSGGDIRLVEGTAKVKLSTSGGDIQVEKSGGETDVSTSGGDIKIKSVVGRVRASTSGGDIHAKIVGPVSGDCSLTTSGGEVVVSVDAQAAFDLKAHTSGGDVDAAGLTITITGGGVGKNRLQGKVNGGGPQLNLGSSGGDIRIRAE